MNIDTAPVGTEGYLLLLNYDASDTSFMVCRGRDFKDWIDTKRIPYCDDKDHLYKKAEGSIADYILLIKYTKLPSNHWLLTPCHQWYHSKELPL